MSFSKIALTVACVGALLAPTVGQAASLGDIQGKVLLDQGSGFKAVTQPTTVNSGDRVMASGDASATINYSNCQRKVQAGAVVTVAPESICADHASEHGASDGSSGGAGTIDSGTVGAIGVAAVVGGAVIYATRSHKSSP